MIWYVWYVSLCMHTYMYQMIFFVQCRFQCRELIVDPVLQGESELHTGVSRMEDREELLENATGLEECDEEV